MTESHNIIIVGAGLSGLYCAWQLEQQGHDNILIIESRNRTGGRILSPQLLNDNYDMGPAWVWLNFQPRLNQLITHFNINVFKQFTAGDMLYEKTSTEVERYTAQSSQGESYRVENGAHSLIKNLQSQLKNVDILLNTNVTSIKKEGLSIQTSQNGDSRQYSANKVILALPARLILQNIKLIPEFSPVINTALQNTATWMSTHCKISFIYSTPFWREQNLSGEVFSHCGPLSEIYDACPASQSFYALTAFVGLNVLQRTKIDKAELIKLCLDQLQRLFGDASKNPLDIQIKDWSNDKNTATEKDLISAMQHPHYPADVPRDFWDNNLILAGTEVAREHGGYLEGALESADDALVYFKDVLFPTNIPD